MSLIRSVRFTPLFVQPSPVVKASPFILPKPSNSHLLSDNPLLTVSFQNVSAKLSVLLFSPLGRKGT